jgi:hypothetical protein
LSRATGVEFFPEFNKYLLVSPAYKVAFAVAINYLD